MSATQKLLRFGVFELNLTTEELRKSGTLLKLPPQPFKLLVLLASHAGQVVTREEIQQELWGKETYVDFEQGMNHCIKQIRGVLNDNIDNPLYVETLPRRGYRFLAPVVSKTIPAPPPKVVESKSGIQSSIAAALTPEGTRVPGTLSPPPRDPVEAVKKDTAAANPAAPASTLPTPPVDVAPPASVASATPPAGPLVPAPESGRRFGQGRLVGIGVIGLTVIAGILFWRWQQPKQLTEKDTVVLADFDNTTGEPVFDSALKQALTVDLEQSPFLNVLSDQKINEQLRFMGSAPDTRLSGNLAREVCQRSGSKAMLLGSISQLGSHYVVGVEASNCETGDSLGSEQLEASGPEQVLSALGRVASKLRQKLGESLASVQKYDTPVEQATTPSLEALKAYSLGIKMGNTSG